MPRHPVETHYEALRRKGVSRRDFLQFCSLAAVALGLGPLAHLEIANAMQTRPYLPVVWINGLSCSCCTESFIRSSHPLASDIILSMIALDYQDCIMAAAGTQAEQNFEEAIADKGNYILAVEGNAPLGADGMFCIDGGRPFLDKLQRGAAGAKAIIAWGNCASWGCVQAAYPNPTDATPVHKLIHDKPVIKIPGCPPIPEVMSNVLAYILTYNRLPALDGQGRPEV
ncbi:MAG: hydrogenase small subunit, partial [Bilophila sp.]